ETAVETDLTLIDYFDNQCVPQVDASVPVVAGQAYYVYVANTDAITDIVIDGTFFLGANDNLINGFTYHPNPASTTVTLNSVEVIERVSVFNILGQQVIDQEINAISTDINVADLAVGAYIMKVSVNGQIGTYKIIKQ
ncbi:MAG: T9SS type A sorting domain-containing protein, partial [Flavobacteriaceae bacterium]|nr:T9SS type A sorting domain-containing protein [Flavobacteriaceae bacterium]